MIKERNGPNIYTEAENGPKREIDQAKLFSESEIVSTGLLKFDIFEASESQMTDFLLGAPTSLPKSGD